MFFASWTALLLGSVLCGAAVVAAMVAPRERQVAMGMLTVPALAIAGAGLVGVAVHTVRVDESVIAGLLAVGAFIGGFALAGTSLPRLAKEPPLATVPDITKHDPASRTGVVIMCCAEPSTYQPAAVARMLEELQDAEVPLPPEFARVFVYASEKARYRLAGGSPARDECRLMTDRVAELLANDGRFMAARLALCDEAPCVDHVVAALAAEGAREIVVAHLAVAEDAVAARAKRRVDAIRPEAHGLHVSYAQPLWTSGALAERLAERVMDAAGDTPPGNLGVALLGHGQPAELDRINPAMTEQETLFHQRIRAELIDRGLDGGRVRLGWMEWLEPGVTEVVRHLVALGSSKVIVVPSAMPADTVTTMLDIRDGVSRSRVEGTSELTILPAWGPDARVAEIVAANVREAAAELA